MRSTRWAACSDILRPVHDGHSLPFHDKGTMRGALQLAHSRRRKPSVKSPQRSMILSCFSTNEGMGRCDALCCARSTSSSRCAVTMTTRSDCCMSRPTYRGAVVTEAGARDWENRGEADMPVQSARGVPAHITWTRGAQQPDCTIAEFRQRRPFWHRSVKMRVADSAMKRGALLVRCSERR